MSRIILTCLACGAKNERPLPYGLNPVDWCTECGFLFGDGDGPNRFVPLPPPLVSFAQAKAIGEPLHDRFEAMAEKRAPLTRDDLGWADMVTFVVRKARDAADGRGGDG